MQKKSPLAEPHCLDKSYLLENETPSEQSNVARLKNLSKELRVSLSAIKMQIEAIEDGMYENNDFAFHKLKEKLKQFEHQINTLANK